MLLFYFIGGADLLCIPLFYFVGLKFKEIKQRKVLEGEVREEEQNNIEKRVTLYGAHGMSQLPDYFEVIK
jgi:hypothetical protein